jgi:hypothetical protein
VVEGDGLENRSAKAPGVRIPPPPPESASPFAGGLIPILLATLSWTGCDGPTPCVPGVDQTGRYKVDVVERYDEQSQFTYSTMIGLHPGWTQGRCMGADGIGAGASIILRGTGLFGRRSGSCDSVTADLSPPPAELSVVGAATDLAVTETLKGNGSALFFMGDVTFGGCAGTLGLAVLPGYRQADFFTPPVAGDYPPAVLFKVFVPADPSNVACPSCYEDLVIGVSKL